MKLLLLALDPQEAAVGAGFAQSTGLAFDLLCLTGEAPGDLGAGKAISASWAEVPPADAVSKALRDIAAPYDRIATVSTMAWKDMLPRLSGLLDAPMVSDIVAWESPNRFVRPIYAGSLLATVEVAGPRVLLTIRPAGFPKATRGGESATETLSLHADTKAKRLSVSSKAGGRPDLNQAKVIVSGGRPLKDAATFESVIGGLADALGGAVGATRAAVDSGIASNEMQVGQTGKIVAPDLYIAAGISGSTQHLAGIKDSKVIVAINKDPDAPIFEVADFGLVADLYDAIPAIRERLGK